MAFDPQWLYPLVANSLDLADTDALVKGDDFLLDGVLCRVVRDDELHHVHVFLELGAAHEDREAEVHALLLETQVLLLGQIDAMFIKAPASPLISFVARLQLPEDPKPTQLARAIRALVAQVKSWQSGLLAGRLHDDDAEFEAMAMQLLGEQAAAGNESGSGRG